jgi:hypothetical protein
MKRMIVKMTPEALQELDQDGQITFEFGDEEEFVDVFVAVYCAGCRFTFFDDETGEITSDCITPPGAEIITPEDKKKKKKTKKVVN